MAMRIALSADHAGFELKDLLAAWLRDAIKKLGDVTVKFHPAGHVRALRSLGCRRLRGMLTRRPDLRRR